jgi:hypothetical protein
MSIENVPTPTRVLSDDPVLIAWRRDTSAANSRWAANWAESTNALSSRAKNRSFPSAQVGAKLVGIVDGASVGLRVGCRVGLAVGPTVASQHVTGQIADISAAVLGAVHQPRLRNSWHGVPCMSSPAHEGAAVGADETGEAVGPDVVGVVVGIEVGWCVQPEQVTTQTSRHWLFNGSLQSVLALEIMYIPAQYAADSVSW